MHDGQKFRVAVGVFDDSVNLHQALVDFRAFGLELTQAVLLVETGTLLGQLKADLASQQTAGQLNVPRLMIRRNGRFMNDTGPEASPPQTVTLTSDQLADNENWITP